MPSWGPTSCALGPGGTTPFQAECTLFDSGQVGVPIIEYAGTANETFTGLSSASWGVQTKCYDSRNNLIGTQVNISKNFSAAVSGSWSVAPPQVCTRILIEHVCSLNAGQDCDCTASGSYNVGTNCSNGTQLNPTANPIIYITQQAITAVLSPIGGAFLEPVLSVLIGETLDLSVLCGTGPPAMPTIDTSTLKATVQTAFQIFESAAWFTYCQCAPGTPTPVPYPPPSLTQPPGWPTPPSFTCTDTDICAALVTMQAQLTAMQMSVSEINQLVTLLQRYRLPFAYVPGATHSGLVNSQSIAVSGLLGVEVLVEATPTDVLVLPGTPGYVWDVGWMSVSSPDGMLQEQRITRQSMVWFPQEMPLANSWGYFLNPGWGITMRELEAET